MLFQNFTMIEGRLTEKPEIKTTKNGKKYCRFSICYNQQKKLSAPDENGKEWTSVPHFFNILTWEKNAEKIAVCNKGDPVSCSGKLQFSEWTNKEGYKKYTVYILADTAHKLDMEKKPSASESTSIPTNPDEIPEVNFDDIPFDDK